jgi:two-component system sensor histidine kinase RegB
METLGEPYVTTRPGAGLDGEIVAGAEERHSGLGLGFFIAKTLLERSGADVTIGNRETGTGAIVRVRWSRAAFEGAAAQPVAAWPGRVPKSRGA